VRNKSILAVKGTQVMETLTETISTINEATLKAIGTMQEQVLAFNREVVAALSKIELPSWLPAPEPTDVPLDALTKQAYDFQAQRVAADKQFALDLLGIWAQPARKAASSSSPAK
jgi:hypothetical protein